MADLGTDCVDEGWNEVRRRLERLARVHAAALWPPAAMAFLDRPRTSILSRMPCRGCRKTRIRS
jgi:hypothetical protein